MNDIHKAYHALGLEPGAMFETIKRRYRRLALVWHPDRMSSADAKREAEEELKKINNMFERLKKHFETEHKSGPSCRCQPTAAAPNNSHNSAGSQKAGSQSTGPTEAERKRQEEEEEEATRKRTEERQKKAAEEEAIRRTTEAAQRAQQNNQAAEDALKDEAERKDEALRWKSALTLGIVFIGLIAYCWLGCLARDITHGISKQWEDFQSWLTPKQQAPPPTSFSQSPEPSIQPYIPPYELPPTGDITSWRQYIEDATQQNEDRRDNWPFAPPAPPPSSR